MVGAGVWENFPVASCQSNRVARPPSLSSRAMEAREPPISRLRVARSFRHLGALRVLSLRLEPNYNRHFSRAGWRVHGGDFRRTHRTNRRVVGGTAHTLYRTILRRSRNGDWWAVQKRRG